MSVTMYSAPTNPFLKTNGKWAVDHFPKGVPTEHGEYPDQQTAQKVYEVLTSNWLCKESAYVTSSDS